MSGIHLKIITPESEVFDDEVSQVNVPSSDGELGILPHHTDLMAKIIPGELKINKDGKIFYLATGAGFVQVHKNTVTVLTDLAESVDSIDERVVEEAKKRAQQALEQKLSDEEYAETLAVLEKSLAQLKVKKRHRAR